MASLRSIIQREIVEVKHAISNNAAYEGVVGEDLQGVLNDLLIHRAEVIARSKVLSHQQQPRPAKPEATAHTPAPVTPSREQSKTEDVEFGQQQQRNKFTRVELQTTSKSAKKAKGATTNGVANGGGAKEVLGKRPAPASEERKVTGDSNQRNCLKDEVRQIRRDIEVGDVLSVLMDIRLLDRWVRSWVAGEVLEKVSRCCTVAPALFYCRVILAYRSRLGIYRIIVRGPEWHVLFFFFCHSVPNGAFIIH